MWRKKTRKTENIGSVQCWGKCFISMKPIFDILKTLRMKLEGLRRQSLSYTTVPINRVRQPFVFKCDLDPFCSSCRTV
jgi:hypothetical protein